MFVSLNTLLASYTCLINAGCPEGLSGKHRNPGWWAERETATVLVWVGLGLSFSADKLSKSTCSLSGGARGGGGSNP